MILDVTLEEVSYLLVAFPSNVIWPQPYARWDFAFLPPGEQETAGGVSFRLKVIAARQFAVRHPNEKTYPLEITLGELWLIEQVLGFVDFAKMRMVNGTPVLNFANKVWDLCVTQHADIVQPEFRPPSTTNKIIPPEEFMRQRALLADIDQVIGDTE